MKISDQTHSDLINNDIKLMKTNENSNHIQTIIDRQIQYSEWTMDNQH